MSRIMTHGIDTESKQKTKKRDFSWLHKDMLDNKGAVESYCDRVGTLTEQEKQKSRKKKK